MIARPKKIAARFFTGESGRKPVHDWLLALDADDRRVIGYDIQTVEFGCPIGVPVCRPLGDGLWEVRSSLAGHRIARVIFCIEDGEMILLHGFMKKTQTTPPADIALARQRRKEVDG